MLICYIKIIDIVLLLIIFRGIGAYTQKVCLLFNLVRLGVHFPRTFSLENRHGRPHRGGGGRLSFRPSNPPPPWKKIFRYLVAFLLLVLHVGVFLQHFFSLWAGIYVFL